MSHLKDKNVGDSGSVGFRVIWRGREIPPLKAAAWGSMGMVDPLKTAEGSEDVFLPDSFTETSRAVGPITTGTFSADMAWGNAEARAVLRRADSGQPVSGLAIHPDAWRVWGKPEVRIDFILPGRHSQALQRPVHQTPRSFAARPNRSVIVR